MSSTELAVGRFGDRQSARWFVEEASGDPWPAVLDQPVPARAGEAFLSLLERREAGEPVQYVLGHWSFRELDLLVDRRVLIPRPETEVVVDVALAELARLRVAAPLVVDLGTGSGAIALSIATEAPGPRYGPPTSPLRRWRWPLPTWPASAPWPAGGSAWCRESWWSALPEELKGTVDMVVTNPPYVAGDELAGLPAEVWGWEPHHGTCRRSTVGWRRSKRSYPRRRLARRPFRACLRARPPAGGRCRQAGRGGRFPGSDFVRPDLAGRDRVLVAQNR